MTPNLDFKVMIFWASNNSKMVQDRAIVTTANEYKLVYNIPSALFPINLTYPNLDFKATTS